MKKTIISTVAVTSGAAKIQFQIMLPRNTRRITSVRVTADGWASDDEENRQIGSLWLSLPGLQESFFSENLKAPVQRYGQASYAPLRDLCFKPSKAWTEGGKSEALALVIEPAVTMIEGYYVDELSQWFEDDYTVKIYLTIEQ